MILGFVGPSGSGKTLLTKALEAFYKAKAIGMVPNGYEDIIVEAVTAVFVLGTVPEVSIFERRGHGGEFQFALGAVGRDVIACSGNLHGFPIDAGWP